MKKVLFVCTGNTCRSPMAEAIFNKLCDKEQFSASSCGIYGDGASPVSENARLALSEAGIDFSHISTPISQKSMDEADCIIGISASHASTLMNLFPKFSDKIFAMPTNIPDPYGCDIDTYRACRDMIKKNILMIIDSLSGDKNERI